MEITEEQMPIWEEIDHAESCLVCCLFDDAASLASSILRRLLDNSYRANNRFENFEDYENELDDMLESAAMVLVQSLKQTTEILKELKLLFGSITAIPVQVFLTGVCFQMSESPSATVQGSLEEFLNSWRYMDDRYYPIEAIDGEGSLFRFSIGVDEYLEVVELYVIRLLAMTMRDRDRSISWVEKATIPMEKRQELLRRLQSMNSSNVNSSSQTSISPQLPNGYLLQEQNSYSRQSNDIEPEDLSRGQYTVKEEILKFSQPRAPYLWWFPTLSLKLGNSRIIVPTGKMLLALVFLLIYYFTRKKKAALKRFLAEKALSTKNALVDLWKIMFSYQVNPLAAVQTLPTPARGNH